jgi:transcriptional regulator with XRE-family HTH domain
MSEAPPAANIALETLGTSAQQRRIALNLTQSECARRAGISSATLQRFEAGQSIQLSAFLRVLCALEVTDFNAILERVLPTAQASPMALLKLGRSQRQRVRGRQR